MQFSDFELALRIAVLPPAMAADKTPSERRKGKLKGLIIKVTPYGILYTFAKRLGKATKPAKCLSGLAQCLRFLIASLISEITVPISQK